MRKKETELELAWLQWWRHYGDGAGSPELSGGDGKIEQGEATKGPFLRQREAKGGHRRDWKPGEARRR